MLLDYTNRVLPLQALKLFLIRIDAYHRVDGAQQQTVKRSTGQKRCNGRSGAFGIQRTGLARSPRRQQSRGCVPQCRRRLALLLAGPAEQFQAHVPADAPPKLIPPSPTRPPRKSANLTLATATGQPDGVGAVADDDARDVRPPAILAGSQEIVQRGQHDLLDLLPRRRRRVRFVVHHQTLNA